jgi:hypothetical protein
MTVKSCVALAFAFLLSGCWVGPNFYTIAQAERPLAAGKYKHVNWYHINGDVKDQDLDNPDARVRIAYDADGRVIINNGEDDGAKTLLVKLEGVPDTYIAQIELAYTNVTSSPTLYGLVRVMGDRYRISLPRCDGTRRLAPGSRVIVGGLLDKRRKCSFSDRATFEDAMRAFAKDPVSWHEYKLIKKKGG